MIDLTNVKATGDRLPVGGYVLTIKKAQDIPHDEYVEVVYDIAEGEYKGFYKDEEDWKHTTRRYYKGNAGGMFKAFIEKVAKDNPQFNAEEVISGKSCKGLIGCNFGAVINTRLYTKQDGTDGEAQEVAQILSCDKIRKGEYTLKEPRDTRKKQENDAPVIEVSTGDVPF